MAITPQYQIRAAVYGRVSTEEQAERGTIENQLEFGRKYGDLHQIEIVRWYKDDGVSGTIPLESREEGAKLLEDAKKGVFNLLLIYRLDRLGRSARIILNAVHELEQYGVKIRSMTEPFDTGDPNGRFLLTILAGVADLERETILERMWHGANRAAREGRWLGGIVPYGYRVNDESYLEVNEEPLPGMDMSEADVVRLIYRLTVEQKMSTVKIADYLNALGVPPSYTKDGRKVKRGKRQENTAGIWRPSRIRNMIINETYKGIHHYGKRASKERDLILRQVPAIVSEEVWDKAQLVLRENQIESMRNAKRQNLLRGLIRCGCCGLNYGATRFPSSKGTHKPYYICNGKTTYRGPYLGKCPSRNIPAEWIEKKVWDACLAFIENPGEAMKELAATMETRSSCNEDYEAERNLIMKAIEEKEIEKQSILDLFRKKIIGSADVEIQFKKIEQEKASLQERVKVLSEQIEEEQDLLKKFDNLQQLLANLREKLRNNDSFEVRREIVKTLVKEIIIHSHLPNNGRKKPRATVEVRYTFFKGVNHTDARVAFIVRIRSPHVRAPLSKFTDIGANYQGR
ncbi:serine recombinase [Collibacillus ludicampi]|uniref:Serine recombinase n=1 Tax=Collibacillus ludicampi TaxID=2771369 RepID=A0AAV4LIL2_9BACL|nr:recombinase family protein [Collibacillus ludicampi]GIM47581.1 serine recombinase [Collibacillus ludicampi]